MNRLGIPELITVGRDLTTRRAEILGKLAAGKVFLTLLNTTLTGLEALPDAYTKPRVGRISALDRQHDTYWRLIVTVRELLLAWPNATPAIEAAAAALTEGFGGPLREVSAPYLVEVKRAEARAAALVKHEAALAAIALPEGTLKDLVAHYIESGRALGAELSGRADDLAERGTGAEAGRLRCQMLNLMSDLRTVVRHELDANPDLPRNLEAELFGLIDEATELATARVKREPAPAP